MKNNNQNFFQKILKSIWSNILMILIIVAPIGVNLGITRIDIKSTATNGEWLSFWGSYLGIIFAVGTALLQLKKEKMKGKIELKKDELKSFNRIQYELRKIIESIKMQGDRSIEGYFINVENVRKILKYCSINVKPKTLDVEEKKGVLN